MEQNVVSSRQPIENLSLDDPTLFSPILESFDMFREVLSPELKLAIRFSYLEHLLRISTEYSDSETGIQKLPEPVRGKLKNLLNSRPQLLQGTIHALDALILQSDLLGVVPEIINFNYVWTGKKLNKQRSDFGNKPKLAVSYSFTFKDKLYILYTVNMTYIDGFDPFTAATKIPIVTQGMIKGMSKEFFAKAAVSVEIQTESKGRKKTQNSISSPRGSVRGSIKNEPRSPGLKNTSREEILNEDGKIKNLNEEDKGFEFKQDGSDSDEQREVEDVSEVEEEDEEEEEEEEETGSVSLSFEQKKLPTERAWEKYQKRATEKQKERDQCAPGDCGIF